MCVGGGRGMGKDSVIFEGLAAGSLIMLQQGQHRLQFVYFFEAWAQGLEDELWRNGCGMHCMKFPNNS